MMTVNLEKKLIKENRKLILPAELLLVREYDKFSHIAENDALERVGINRSIVEGGRVKKRVSEKKQETEAFSQERVFHISQIQSICMKYRLRFLRTEYYKGTVDEKLADRITTFEVAYSKKCNERNTMIMAPIESFELEEKPKDPLFFYRINDEYYYLIHKWGNDLSIFRRSLTIFENGWVSMFIVLAICLLPIYIVSLFTVPSEYPSFLTLITRVICGVVALFCIIMNLVRFGVEDEPFRLLRKNNWDSAYK